MPRILVVDDKEMMRDSLEAILTRTGYVVRMVGSAIEALKRLEKQSFDVILTDLKMPRMDGLQFLDEVRTRQTDALVIMMTAFATIDTAVEAMRKGAYDYIQKPFDADEIILLLARGLEHRRLQKENEAFQVNARDEHRGRELIGSSPAMLTLKERIELVAASSATVFIRGDSGTGKELIARSIHRQSARANNPFLCVNCAALSSSLLESELFGHEKGAFTGADQMRKGRFELADGGTLLLDEISEMDLELQAKLLRVLQEREFERVGSSLSRQVNVRVIATTNRDLDVWAREGRFREDLYYRLNVVPIQVPPLCQRSGEDIEALCEYYLNCCAAQEGKVAKVLSRSALAILKNYSWPGNVRELENLMERISILDAAEVITDNAIRIWLDGSDTGKAESVTESGGMKLADLERDLIEKTLENFDGHRQKTAESLGIGVRTLGMKLKKWKSEESLPVA
jgi:DNA-binding NtrC family response regulator